MADKFSVREITSDDIELITDYWTTSDPSDLVSMGVDLVKIPSRQVLTEMLQKQLSQPYEEKISYAIIWLLNGKPSGHSNVNKIVFGNEASMHLHIWNSVNRQKGFGLNLLKLTLPYFFNNLKLRKIYCEPFAFNPAPNNTIRNLGFEFIKCYRTIPGDLNFEQDVNRWELTFEKFQKIM